MFNEILKIAEIMVTHIITLWPYLVITIPLAVAVNITGASKYINKALTKRPLTAIVMATVVGAFSPFCSCGVIPLIASLLIGGVPLAPVMAFWLASPSMDPEIFFLSVSIIGWDLAVWRLAATFAMSLGAGFVTHFFVIKGWLGNNIIGKNAVTPVESTFSLIKKFVAGVKNKLMPSKESLAFAEVQLGSQNKSCGCSSDASSTTCRQSSTTVVQEPTPQTAGKIKNHSFKKLLLKETINASVMVAKFMTLAFFLQALIVLYVPSELIINMLGQNNPFAIITAALVGIPVYTSSAPALAMMGGLLNQGMSAAAVLTFLIAGPTTTLPAMAAVWNIASRKVFILYISFTLISAVVAGYLYMLVNLF